MASKLSHRFHSSSSRFPEYARYDQHSWNREKWRRKCSFRNKNFSFQPRSVFLLAGMQRNSNHLLCEQIVGIFCNCGVFHEPNCIVCAAVRCAFTLIVNRDHRPDSSRPNRKRMNCRNRGKKMVFRSREAIIPNASGNR